MGTVTRRTAFRAEFAPPKELEGSRARTGIVHCGGWADILISQVKDVETGSVRSLFALYTDVFADKGQPFRLHLVERSTARSVSLQVVLRDRNQCREAAAMIRLRVDTLARDVCVVLSSLLQSHVLRSPTPSIVLRLVEV